MELPTIVIGDRIELPPRDGITRGRSDLRFSDPKWAYHPRPQKKWKKQTFKVKKQSTPVGKLTKGSWDFIVQEGESLEDSGMQTKILTTLPICPVDVDQVKVAMKHKITMKTLTRGQSKLETRSLNNEMTINYPTERSHTAMTRSMPIRKPSVDIGGTSISEDLKKLLGQKRPRPRLGASLHIIRN